MGKGFGELTKIIAEQDAQRAARFTSELQFRLTEGQEAIVRFLEQGDMISWAYCAKVERRSRNGKVYNEFIPTRDQDGTGATACPIRERGMRVNVRAWINLIWRDAPIYAKTDRGYADRSKIIGNEDQVAVWAIGPVVAQLLAGVDANYKGLSSRDFRITARGESLKRFYEIFPAEDAGPQPMSPEDLRLAESKYDLQAMFVSPKSYDEIVTLLDGPVQVGSVNATPSPEDYNPFARKR